MSPDEAQPSGKQLPPMSSKRAAKARRIGRKIKAKAAGKMIYLERENASVTADALGADRNVVEPEVRFGARVLLESKAERVVILVR